METYGLEKIGLINTESISRNLSPAELTQEEEKASSVKPAHW